jgi:hypothetical protein
VADAAIYVTFTPQAPPTGTELSTVDVDEQWLGQWSGEQALPARPLSSTEVEGYAAVQAGKTSAVFTVPTIKDAVTETDEVIRLQSGIVPRDFGDPIPGPVVTGTVTNVA